MFLKLFASLLILVVFTSNTNAQSPTFFNITGEYEIHSEVNFLEKGSTILVDEWANADGNYYHIETRVARETDHFIFDYKESELYSVKNEICKTTKLGGKESHSKNYLLSSTQTTGVISVAALLVEANQFELTFKEVKFIRGIKSNCYSGAYKGDLDVEVCSSVDEWDKMQEHKSVPLFIKLDGNHTDGSGAVNDVRTEIHILYFLPALPDDQPEVFQTPDGIFCSDRKFATTIPALPEIVSYGSELIVDNSGISQVLSTRTVFDRNLNIMRYEYREAESQKPPFYAFGTITATFDYTTDLVYYQDNLLGNCTIRPIANSSTNMPLAMKHPNELFHIDGKFSYVGEKLLRGIPASYYISRRDDFKFPVLPTFNTTFGLYFLAPNLISTSVGPEVGVQSRVPLQLIIRPHSDFVQIDFSKYVETYNFYNFAETQNTDGRPADTERAGWDYDVRTCYAAQEEKDVRITFLSREDDNFRKYTNLFLRRAMQKIANLFKTGTVGPLRFQHPELDYNTTEIFLTFSIMPKPVLPPEYNNVLNITDNVEIATIVETIRTAIKNQQLIVDIPLTETETESYFATDLNDDIFRINDKFFPTVGRNLEMFEKFVNFQMSVGVRHLPGQYLADDCAKFCLHDSSNEGCKSFNYYFKTGACELSSYQFVDSDDVRSKSTEAFVYSKTSVAGYEMAQGSIKRNDKKSSVVVKSPKECADKCTGLCELPGAKCKCRSFDYCRHQKPNPNSPLPDLEYLCYTDAGHLSDKDASPNIDCDHFSRRLAIDFENTFTQQNTSLAGYSIQYGLDADDCARACVENEGHNCRAFYHCEAGPAKNSAVACAFLTNYLNVSSDGALKCKYFKRETFSDGRTYVPPSDSDDGKSSETKAAGVSAGLTAGLVILFFIVGLVAMFIVLHFFVYKNSEGGSGSVNDVKVYYTPDK